MLYSKEVCDSREFTKFLERKQRGEQRGEHDWGDFDDQAQRYIFPAHWLNSLALVVAYAGFLLWLFRSPHMASIEAVYLDRTCGSFFMLNLLGNVVITGAGLKVCFASYTTRAILISMYGLGLFGISIFGCNVLCHRYLIEKAKTIMKL
jgi:hypothetical protein